MGVNHRVEVAKQLGALVIQFSRLDVLISQAVLYLQGTYDGEFDNAVELCTSDISTRVRDLRSEVESLNLPAEIQKALFTNCERADGLIETRNDLTHGLWLRGAEEFIGVRRLRRGKGETVQTLHQDADQIKDLVNQATEVAMEIAELLADNRVRDVLAARGYWVMPEQDEEDQKILESVLRRRYH